MPAPPRTLPTDVPAPPRRLATDVLLDPFDIGWEAFVAAAEAAHAAGFDGVWTWDHVAGQVHQAGSVLECWTALSALAGQVPNIALGPLVLNVANRDPHMLAVMAATLQAVAGGRLLLGLGAGGGRDTPYASEQYALGRSVAGDVVRRRNVAQAAEVMRQLWTGGGHGFLRPDRPPPIVIGAFGPKMAELAGRVGDGINTQAWHPRLGELLDVGRGAHAARREGSVALACDGVRGAGAALAGRATPRAREAARARRRPAGGPDCFTPRQRVVAEARPPAAKLRVLSLLVFSEGGLAPRGRAALNWSARTLGGMHAQTVHLRWSPSSGCLWGLRW